jgi:hypothetical protein
MLWIEMRSGSWQKDFEGMVILEDNRNQQKNIEKLKTETRVTSCNVFLHPIQTDFRPGLEPGSCGRCSTAMCATRMAANGPYLSACDCLSICLSVRLSVGLSVGLSGYLSIYLYDSTVCVCVYNTNK